VISGPPYFALQEARLYGILDLGYVADSKALEIADKMLAGGVQLLQLRAKHRESREILPLARELAGLCREHHLPLIINDHPELVQQSGAAGAHVGQDDLRVADARKFAGDQAIIGKSTHSLTQAVAAQREGADYIGFGPLFATPTKRDYTPIGVDAIRAVHQLVSLPIFCIGGIKRENLREVLAAGAQRVVIVSGILQAEDSEAYSRDCKRMLSSFPPAKN
jgi:thiamine-phosphate pyrophosphorylase